jgi:hypothetical protein
MERRIRGPVQPSLQEKVPPAPRVQRQPSTYNLAFSTPKIQEKKTGTIIGGHLQLLEGLPEQHSSGRTRLCCPQCKALVNVHREAAGAAIPRAGCREAGGHRHSWHINPADSSTKWGLTTLRDGRLTSVLTPAYPPAVSPTLRYRTMDPQRTYSCF